MELFKDKDEYNYVQKLILQRLEKYKNNDITRKKINPFIQDKVTLIKFIKQNNCLACAKYLKDIYEADGLDINEMQILSEINLLIEDIQSNRYSKNTIKENLENNIVIKYFTYSLFVATCLYIINLILDFSNKSLHQTNMETFIFICIFVFFYTLILFILKHHIKYLVLLLSIIWIAYGIYDNVTDIQEYIDIQYVFIQIKTILLNIYNFIILLFNKN